MWSHVAKTQTAAHMRGEKSTWSTIPSARIDMRPKDSYGSEKLFMSLQVVLMGLDDAVPHSQDPDSIVYQRLRERLERNEFFRDCLAPQRSVLKVRMLT